MKSHPVDLAVPYSAFKVPPSWAFLPVDDVCPGSPYSKLSDPGVAQEVGHGPHLFLTYTLAGSSGYKQDTLEELHLPEGSAHSSQWEPWHISGALVILTAYLSTSYPVSIFPQG